MTETYNKLIQSLEKKEYAPVYLIDGEEPYYLDLLTKYFEDKILQPAEKDFNLMVLYGKEANKMDVINTCRRFPMFAERQVVILKDASQMRDFNELLPYIENPSPTTIFVIENRFKKVDGRSKIISAAKKHGIYYSSDKIDDLKVSGWITDYGKHHDFHINKPEADILSAYLGNDLQKIVNEIEKVRINVPDEKVLTGELIQKYIGISKDYNIFKLPEALTSTNKDVLYKMVSYFNSNPKNAPMPLVIGVFYSYFNQLYLAQFAKGKSYSQAAAIGYINNNVKSIANRFTIAQCENCLLIIGNYSEKCVGVNCDTRSEELLKEMIGKMEMVLN